MCAFVSDFVNYVNGIRRRHREATEFTFRTDLENLLNSENIKPDILIEIAQEARAENIARKRPDFDVKRNGLILGYIETKPIETDLAAVSNPRSRAPDAARFKKYLEICPNILLTNYRDFHLFRNGEIVRQLSLFPVELLREARVRPTREAIQGILDLLNLFFTNPLELITASEPLASRLAQRATYYRTSLQEELGENPDTEFSQRIWGLYDLFRRDLFEDLKRDEFIDAYVQAVTYGLFVARLHSNGTLLTFNNILEFIPSYFGVTHELFLTLRINTTPQAVEWVIYEILNILNNTDITRIQTEIFGGTGDTFVYFYQNFLAAYDNRKRKGMGVYYTPLPVVRFIIRGIDTLLRNHFGFKGFRDTHINVLDFATGTGTFLLEAFRQATQGTDPGIINPLIRDHILNNFYGFEILIAPYIIAHLKLSAFLRNAGYIFEERQGLKIFLTDTLDDQDIAQDALFPHLANEGIAANRVKTHSKILVVMGNPPYNARSRNNKRFIRNLCAIYRQGLEERNLSPLNDDFVKFIRYAQFKVEDEGGGIVGIITSNTHLEGSTHRVMRSSLFNTFDRIYILNLHGHKRERSHGDENIFDIKMGVAIQLFVKFPPGTHENRENHINYFDTLQNGIRTREEKGNFLDTHTIVDIAWERLEPTAPSYWFTRRDFQMVDTEFYDRCWPLHFIFNRYSVGTETAKDDFFIAFEGDRANLIARVRDALTSNDLEGNIRERHHLEDTTSWNFRRFRQTPFNENFVTPYEYRPFDTRVIYFHPQALSRSRYSPRANESGVMNLFVNITRDQLTLRSNYAIISVRQVAEDEILYNHVFVTDKVADQRIMKSSRGKAYVFPLLIFDTQQTTLDTVRGPRDEFTRTNFTQEFITFIRNNYNPPPRPHQIFNYIYAILNSPEFRNRFNLYLKIGFARVPFTSNLEIFRQISELGQQLVDCHLLRRVDASDIGRFPVAGNQQIVSNRIRYEDTRVYINDTQYFENVPPAVWEFHIGGQGVINQWLKERKGRALTLQDLDRLRLTMAALARTLDIQEQIDELLPQVFEVIHELPHEVQARLYGENAHEQQDD